MPRENRKRGRRRAGQKHHLSDDDWGGEDKKKRRTTEGEDDETAVAVEDAQWNAEHEAASGAGERPFYGLLDEQEQEYFKRADELLELNQFPNPEERAMFLASVFKEAEGKELKMACSQSCSRLLERLLLLSNATQLKALFQKFNGHFLNLVQHRFASHCCEALFIRAAATVTQEMLEPTPDESTTPLSGDAGPLVSMENLFLYTVNELSSHLGFLITDRFASHALRVLLVVLSGQRLDKLNRKSVLKSKKKESVELTGAKKSNEAVLEVRSVPESFKSALESIMVESVLGLETHHLRNLATHPVGNPMLQLMVQLELVQFGKQRAKDEDSIIRKLLPDDPIKDGTDSASFVNGLVYDPVGSRLLETILEHAPGKMFKALYKELFKDRLGSLARNEVAGYIVAKILTRLSSEDLQEARNAIVAEIPNLIERGQTFVIKTLIERCAARDVDTASISDALLQAYADSDGITLSLQKFLNLPPDASIERTLSPVHSPKPASSPEQDRSSAQKPRRDQHASSDPGPNAFHSSLLAQAMLATPGPLSSLMFAAISALSQPSCLHIATTPALSPLLQSALTVPHASLIFRRKLITRFYSHVGRLALDPSGSYVVDAIWAGTQGMAFARERVAEELAENEQALRSSRSGRKVWRNWKMDLYKRRSSEWIRMVRGEVGNDGFLSFPGGEGGDRKSDSPRSRSRWDNVAKGGVRRRSSAGDGENGGGGVRKQKSKLDLARERYAMSQRG